MDPAPQPRPRPIVLFERLSLGALVIGAVGALFVWRDIAAQMPADVSIATVLAVQALVFFVYAGLVLMVSRRRSNVARWILTVLFAIGAVSSLGDLAAAFAISPLAATVNVVQLAMLGAAILLTFNAAARPWFAR